MLANNPVIGISTLDTIQGREMEKRENPSLYSTHYPQVLFFFNNFNCYNILMQSQVVDNNKIHKWAKEVVFKYPYSKSCAESALKQHKERTIELRKEYDFFCSLLSKYYSGGEYVKCKYLVDEEYLPKIEKEQIYLTYLKECLKIYKNLTKEDLLDVERARSIPVEDIVEFNRYKKALCLWHTDSNPSMHLYKKDNRVWCFACNKGGDVIDVAQALHGVGFKEAVKILNND